MKAPGKGPPPLRRRTVAVAQGTVLLLKAVLIRRLGMAWTLPGLERA
jgi:hypothetical protein